MRKKTGRTRWEAFWWCDTLCFQEEIVVDYISEDYFGWFSTGWSICRDRFRWKVKRFIPKELKSETVTWFWRKKQAMDYVEVLYRMGVEL